MSTVTERFLRYVKIDTQSVEDAPVVPSTDKQFTLAKLLMEELTQLGARDVVLNGNCYVMATIPANCEEDQPTIGLIAHMDTATEISGANVKPVLTKDYDGGDIDMGNGYTLSPKQFPTLLDHISETVISTDGTTLLGADDKAGVAEIMTLCEKLLRPDAPKHGRIRICFTPDEEVGCGTKYFDVERFDADFAYTVDGGALGDVNYENFNAAGGTVTFHGTSIHPGSAKGKMVNALHLAMEFDRLLPVFENPACTSGYEGFFCLENLSGSIDNAESYYLIRDHDMEKFHKKQETFRWAAEVINQKYGAGSAVPVIKERYYNMVEKVDYRYVERVIKAMESVGVKPLVSPIRGGTDGANLSFMGLPCPNLCTGGYNFHGRYEYITVEAMEKVVEILTALVCAE